MSKLSRLVKRTHNGRKMVHKLRTIEKVSNKGKIFSVKFIKKDGSERIMTVRKGVKSFLRGGGYNTVSHLPQYMTLFSINDKGYRNLNLCTLKEIKGQGKVYTFK